MTLAIDGLMVLLVLSNLMVLGTGRLAECIRMVALQGIALGILPLLAHTSGWTIRLFLLAVGSLTLKGFVFPWMLSRAVREARVRREVQPFVGSGSSILVGATILAVALRLSGRLPLPAGMESTLALPTALFMILTGLFLIVSRKTALSQVLGYLVMENGIYVFGVAVVRGQPLLVELGVLLDVFVGVFVMGIMMFHINREFDHINVDRLAALRDSEP